jgi:DNA-binding SARP family transcriptional activator
VANVRSYAASLRRQFQSLEPGRDRLVCQGSGYRLDAGAAEVDLLAFVRDSGAGREELRRGYPAAAAAKLAVALGHWRGPMLAGLPRTAAGGALCRRGE